MLKHKCGKKTKDAAHITRYFFYQLITKDLTTSGAVSERPATFSIYDVSTP